MKQATSEAASALVKARWDKTPAPARSEHARKMLDARWAENRKAKARKAAKP